MYKLSMLRQHLARMWTDENGATSIEYALIAAGISVAIIASVYGLGSSIQDNLYNKIANIL